MRFCHFPAPATNGIVDSLHAKYPNIPAIITTPPTPAVDEQGSKTNPFAQADTATAHTKRKE